MPDFRELTLILYSLIGISPKIWKSLIATISTIIVFSVTFFYFFNIEIATLMFIPGISNFLALFILSAIFAPIFIKEKNIKNYAALSFVTTFFCLIFISISILFTNRIFLFGISFIFIFSYIYIAIFSRAKLVKRLFICLIHSIIVFLVFFQISIGLNNINLLLIEIFVFNNLIAILGVVIIEKTMDAPMIHLIKMIWNDGGRVLLSSLMKGNFSIDDANPDLGEHTDLPVKILKISDTSIVFPGIHPGPFGEIGGSRIPSFLSDKLNGNIFTLHTPTTHDFNPIKKDELGNIEKAIKNANFIEKKTCSKLIKKSDNDNSIIVNCMVFGKEKPIAFIILELYGLYGDVGFEIWEVTNQIANNLGYFDVFISDAHNYFSKEEKSARLGTPTGDKIKKLIEEALADGLKSPQYNFEFASYKMKTKFREKDGFGLDGIGTFAFKLENETIGFLYLDGNSIIPEVNKQLNEMVNKNWNHGIILTTDTHAVHTMGTGYNPIGKSTSIEELKKLTFECIKNLEFKKEISKTASTKANIWIWSPDLGTRYLQALDTELVAAKLYVPSILGFTILSNLLVTFLLGNFI